MRKRIVVGLAFFISLVMATQVGGAEEYPSHPIRVLVPAAAGGAADISARLAADALSRILKIPVLVENHRGGAGAIEAYVAGEADGYTILLAPTGAFTITPAVKRVSYDVEKDFAPLGIVWRSALGLFARAGSNLITVEALVTAAKSAPHRLTVGSSGVGTPSHLTIELLKWETGIDLIHVPFRSSGESLSALLGGQIDTLVGEAQVLAPQVQSRSVSALAIAAPGRIAALPDALTMAEAGFPGVLAETWYGYVVLAKTQPTIIKRLQDALSAVHDDQGFQEKLARYHVSAGEPGPEAFAPIIKADTQKWQRIISAAGIGAE
jgi:tripartite-type tricarboxylate transporter receptor subunit TctC